MKKGILEELLEDVKYIHHPNKKGRYIREISLPFRRITTDVWVTETVGPGELDRIFFRLIQSKVNTREELAKYLGVDEDEFIFEHLEILIRDEYIKENAGKYSLTESGQGFYDGSVEETKHQKCEYKFIWSDIGNCIEDEDGFTNLSEKSSFPIEHGHIDPPSQDDLLEDLPEHYNNHNEDGLIFYDITSSFHQERRSKPYVALLYINEKDENDWRIDLRVPSEGAPSEENTFIYCEDLTEKVNQNKNWRERIKKFILAQEHKERHA